jgi:tripartite-type tricarboxylate transporter receptor subunit TctC
VHLSHGAEPTADKTVPLSRVCRSGRRHLLLGLAMLAVGAVHAQTPNAAAYPNKPVRMVVSYAAGNVTDLLARIVAEKLTAKWGQSVIVDNRAGQGGSLGAQIASKTPADGYTLLFSAMAAMAINPHVYANVGYDANKDFAPVVSVAFPSLVMVVDPSLKINNFKALVEYSKANPTALNYGTAGNGTVPHLSIEALKLQTGLIAQHVPYKSATAVTTDLIAGRVQIQYESISVLLPHIKSNRVTPIAAGTVKRLPQLPDSPSLAEAIPSFTPVVPWLGIVAPAGTPKPIVNKIYQDVSAILQQPDVQEKFAANGLIITGDGPEAFARQISYDYERLGKLVKQLGVKAE